MPEETSRWLANSRMSDLAEFAPLLDQAPADVEALSRIVQGLLIHLECLSAYGLSESDGSSYSRETLPVAQRLKEAFALDPSPIDVARPPERRSPGTCRDFALMLCSFLRRKNVPARLRCGFASYFSDNWEDHWVCEYWRAPDSWRLADPQIDGVLKALRQIDFDPADVPRDLFKTAGQAWLECRAGKFAFDNFGHGRTTGQWFIRVNVMRDSLALKDTLTSVWDEWRIAGETQRRLTEAEVANTDALVRGLRAAIGAP